VQSVHRVLSALDASIDAAALNAAAALDAAALDASNARGTVR